MRVITWNVNSLKARLPRVEQLLRELAPDLLCVQETKSRPEAFPHAALADLGYRAVDHSAGRWGGVALLAPDGNGLTDPLRGLPGEPDDTEARWVEATLHTADTTARVVSVYVPNGRVVGSEHYDAKLRFLDAMRDRIATLTAEGHELVVCGDLNVAPTDGDIWDPAAFAGATHVTGDERARFRALLDAGTVDAYRQIEPATSGYTWWDYRAGAFARGWGMRIDFTLLTPGLAGGLWRCEVARAFRKGEKPSDHAPLVADLDPDRDGWTVVEAN